MSTSLNGSIFSSPKTRIRKHGTIETRLFPLRLCRFALRTDKVWFKGEFRRFCIEQRWKPALRECKSLDRIATEWF